MPEGYAGVPRPFSSSNVVVEVESFLQEDADLTPYQVSGISDGKTLNLENAEYEVYKKDEDLGPSPEGMTDKATVVKVDLGMEMANLGLLQLIARRLDNVMEQDVNQDTMLVKTS